MPFTMGKALKGWGVVRKSPWHFAGLYSTKQEADARRRRWEPATLCCSASNYRERIISSRNNPH
jgi:hypothetical protein